MTYQETIDFLFSQLPVFQRIGKAAYKADLENTKLLDKHFNHPHRKYQIIHVAGTNGKGSVSHILASILQEAGFSTGLYTSPHYLDFRERIKVNGEFISKEYIIDFVENSKEIIEKISPSFFELTVVMAFDYFRAKKVDVAVVETGMGGRLDSTNIVTPLVSVITNIGHDHQQFLGDSPDKIAGEKAGIIKKGVPVVIGETQEQTQPVFKKKSSELGCEISFADKELLIPYSMLTTDQKQQMNVEDSHGNIIYKNLKLDLLGQYQIKNIKTVLQTAHIIKNKLKITDEAIYRGTENVSKNTGILGRFMTLSHNPRIICDAAHNQEGITLLFEQIKNTAYKNLLIIVGFVNDKNIDKIIPFFPKQASYYFTKADIPRALNESEARGKFIEHGYQGAAITSVKESLEAAQKDAGKDDLILICGSTFVVAEGISFFQNKNLA